MDPNSSKNTREKPSNGGFQQRQNGPTSPPQNRHRVNCAYTKILQAHMVEFPNIGWEALRNKHTAWKKRAFSFGRNDIDFDDFEAEIERLFPQPES